MHTTPVSLLERLHRPDEHAAWDRFVELYSPLLFHWASRAGLPPEDAADLVQDVFVTLVEKLPGFNYDRGKSFRAWLHAVTMNKYRDRRKAQAPAPALDPAALDHAAAPDPLDHLIDTEYRRLLARRALELMQADFQPATWKACWDSVVEGRSAAAIAAELGITVSAVYCATCRVLARLRAELAGLLE